MTSSFLSTLEKLDMDICSKMYARIYSQFLQYPQNIIVQTNVYFLLYNCKSLKFKL